MQLLTKWFKRKDDSVTLIENPHDLADKIPSELWPLWQLYSSRQLLSLRWNDTSLTYQTLILAIDLQRGILWLDDVAPAQLQMEVNDKVILRHQVADKELVIDGRILALANEFGARGFAIALPGFVVYSPRRRHPRHCPHADAPLFAQIRAQGGESLLGVIQDISLGGMKIHLPGHQLHQFKPGSMLALCEYQYPGQRTIQEDARVCSARFEKSPHRGTQVSVNFADNSDIAVARRDAALKKWLFEQHQLKRA